MIPDYLYHYYDCSKRPFLNLSDLAHDEAEVVLQKIKQNGESFASKRANDYLTIRRELEGHIRNIFVAKNGKPQRATPHYMILGRCDWVKGWYTQGCEVAIPLAKFNPEDISFTYGDSFPAMRYSDNKPYRKQVYTLAELPSIIEQFGLPQEWNPDGEHGPERYIEAQIWDNAVLDHLLENID
jgi:hypothetical protein